MGVNRVDNPGEGRAGRAASFGCWAGCWGEGCWLGCWGGGDDRAVLERMAAVLKEQKVNPAALQAFEAMIRGE